MNEVISSAFAEFKEMAVVNTLRSCQLFTGPPQPDLQNIAAATVVRSVEKGEFLFHEERPSGAVFPRQFQDEFFDFTRGGETSRLRTVLPA